MFFSVNGKSQNLSHNLDNGINYEDSICSQDFHELEELLRGHPLNSRPVALTNARSNGYTPVYY
jgi:hypothetical protein